MKTLTRSLPLAAAAALLIACGEDDEAPAAAGVKLRVAHLSPDAPAVDVCVASAGSGQFSGPLLEGFGGAAGLDYGQVTRYLDLVEGSYDVRVVAGAAADCQAPVVPDTAGVALEGGRAYTVVATGLAAPGAGEPAFALVPFADETEVAPGKAKLRFIHASPGTPPVDVGTGSGASFAPVFTAVSFAAVDEDLSPAGYLETSPLSDVTVSARATGTTDDALVLPGVTLPEGAIVTVFASGLLGESPPLAALVCADDTAASGLLSECVLAP